MSVRGGLKIAVAGLVILAALGVAAALARAETVLHSEVDSRRVGVEDQVQLTITAEGSSLPDQVALPALTNLRVVGGPSVSTSMSWVNGRSSQSRSWMWVLQPAAAGHAEVGVVTGPDGATAPAIPIEVVAGSIAPRQAPQRPADPFARDPFQDFFGGGGRRSEPKLFVEARPSRTSLYVGEPLVLTYYLYTQTSVSGIQFGTAPQYPGFWAEDVERQGQPPGESATVGGVPYTRFAIIVKLLYPTKSGRLTIPASTLQVGIARQSVFDAGGSVQRETKPITVEVSPIPDEPGFSGAVGRFKATTSVDRPSLALGEAATLRFRVEGSGNLKWIDRAPEVGVAGAKVYPPQVKSDLQTTANGISGSRTWEFVVVPQTTGALEIPSLGFSYFDPAARHIVRSTTAPLPLTVSGGSGTAGMIPAPSPRSTGGASAGGTLTLRADLERPARGGLSGGVVGLIALGALVLHGLLWGGDRVGRLTSPGKGGASRAAPRNVRGALGELRRVGRDGMTKEKAAGLIEKTIHNVFGSLDGDDSERARAVRTLLDEVHAVRYAPQLGDYSEKLRELAARASDVVRRWA